MERDQIETLGDALPKVMTKVRDEIMPLYQEIGPASTFALMLMRRDLDIAQKALAEGDLPTMISVYQSLKEYKV